VPGSSVWVMRNPDPDAFDDTGVAATALGRRQVREVDEASVLALMAEQRRTARAAEAAELETVVAWADLHRLEAPVDRSEVRSGPGPRGTEGALFLAGPGASGIAEFAVCQVAATLSVSERSARRYLGEALELRDRLPRLYAKAVAGVLPVWRARQVAEQTIGCSPEVAAFVDARLADFAHKISAARVSRCVQAALLHCDPAEARARAEAAGDARDVTVTDHLDGVSTLTAILHTPDAANLEDVVAAVAHWLELLGDPDPLPVRRARALGMLADPQAVLDFRDRLTDHLADQRRAAETGDATETPAPRAARPVPGIGRAGTAHSFDLHLHLSDGALGPVARLQGAGRRQPESLAAVEQWLHDLAPGVVVKLTPVVDTTEHIAVDTYEAPPRLVRQIEERDLVCGFPWCGRRGFHRDLDHIVEYVDPDEGGPPGQTNTQNMSRLCRFHHRVKTHTEWTYWREPDGSLTWRSPTRQRFRVDPTGTTQL